MRDKIAWLAAAVAAAGSITAAVAGTSVPAVAMPAHPAIRSYTDTVSITFTGLGKDAQFLNHMYRSEQVVLRPAIAYYLVVRKTLVTLRNKQTVFKAQYYLVGGKDYAEVNGAKTWTVTPATPRELSSDAVRLNLLDGLAKFLAIPGVTRSGPHQIQVTGTPAKVGAFLTFEYGVTAGDLTSVGIKSVTITLTTDSAGRPLTYTVLAKSKLRKAVITETIAGYNQPIAIKAPV